MRKYRHIQILNIIILLLDHDNYKPHLEYFRWFSVIFHVIVLNLKETIIPGLNIKCLNGKDSELGDWFFDAFSPRGISFDGMMPHACKFPLGRTHPTKNKPFEPELIKPVSKMLEYLTSNADIKNGILTKTCFVFGYQVVYAQFKKGEKERFQTTTAKRKIEEVKKQVAEDLDNFSTRFRPRNLKHFTPLTLNN